VAYSRGLTSYTQNAGKCIPLSRQVEYFNATRATMVAAVGYGAVNALLFKSIFLLGVGSNDLFVFAAAQQSRNRTAAEQQSDAAALFADLLSNYSATITARHRTQSLLLACFSD
jgi:hypothetical protein